MKTYADGQLAASSTLMFTAGQDGPPSDGQVTVSVSLGNSSGANTETVILKLLRAGSTARIIRRAVIVPNGSAVVDNISLSSGDALYGQSTHATTVDFVIAGSVGGQEALRVFDANGNVLASSGSSGTLTGPVTLSVGAPTAALGTDHTNGGALPAGTAAVYPVTGSDGTKGVVINAADQVTGRQLTLGNEVATQSIIVYGPSAQSSTGRRRMQASPA